MKKYPIGIQTFRDLRKEGYVYVDKTAIIYKLMTSGKYFFLSRPRRFGKSLLVDTMQELFCGSKELFVGLWIQDKWDWEEKCPVLRFNFADLDYEELGLRDALKVMLEQIAAKHGVKITAKALKSQFKELIEKVSKKGNVVIIIDEYDKPLIDYLDTPEKLTTHKNLMKSFYSVIKGADPYIRFFFMTGVSRFSKVSVFSDLNNLTDITLHPDYTQLLGINQQELEHYFAEEISTMGQKDPDILKDMKEWYNGYSWDGISTLYNPFSVLNFMGTHGQWDNYWIDTGTPSFLMKYVRENPSNYLFNKEEILTSLDTLKDLNTENLDLASLMFQTGFLTIKEIDFKGQLFKLGYPNREVKQSVLNHITTAFTFEPVGRVLPKVGSLRTAFLRDDIPHVITVLDTLFINIPNPLWIKATEAFYHGIIFNTFQLLGITQESEVFNAHGRVDILVKTNTHIYALEFKLDKSAQEALEQIQEKEYLKPFQLDPRQKVAVGINFSSEKKAVAEYLVKEW